MNKLYCEVLGLNGAFYNTRIQSINGKTMEVVYENNPQLEFTVNYECVRLLPPCPAKFSAEMTVGDEVEVYTRTSDDEPFGWWLGHVRMITGDWRLIEYASGRKGFVLLESIRPKNPNNWMSFEPLVWGYWSEKPEVRLHDTERCHAETQPKERPCQAGVADRDSQPIGRAVGQEKVQPPRTGGHTEAKAVSTEELWETDDSRPPWHLTFEPQPPKVKKSAKRRKKWNKVRYHYTMEDEYDDEELRLTPQGTKVFRLFDGQWQEMS